MRFVDLAPQHFRGPPDDISGPTIAQRKQLLERDALRTGARVDFDGDKKVADTGLQADVLTDTPGFSLKLPVPAFSPDAMAKAQEFRTGLPSKATASDPTSPRVKDVSETAHTGDPGSSPKRTFKNDRPAETDTSALPAAGPLPPPGQQAPLHERISSVRQMEQSLNQARLKQRKQKIDELSGQLKEQTELNESLRDQLQLKEGDLHDLQTEFDELDNKVSENGYLRMHMRRTEQELNRERDEHARAIKINNENVSLLNSALTTITKIVTSTLGVVPEDQRKDIVLETQPFVKSLPPRSGDHVVARLPKKGAVPEGMLNPDEHPTPQYIPVQYV